MDGPTTILLDLVAVPIFGLGVGLLVALMVLAVGLEIRAIGLVIALST
jgi:hypothetical protein